MGNGLVCTAFLMCAGATGDVLSDDVDEDVVEHDGSAVGEDSRVDVSTSWVTSRSNAEDEAGGGEVDDDEDGPTDDDVVESSTIGSDVRGDDKCKCWFATITVGDMMDDCEGWWFCCGCWWLCRRLDRRVTTRRLNIVYNKNDNQIYSMYVCNFGDSDGFGVVSTGR